MRDKYNHGIIRFMLIFCLILFSTPILWAEDIFYRVIEDTPVWQDESFKKQSNAARVLLKGTIVTEGKTAVYLSSIDDIDTYFSSCIYDGENYSIPIATIVPQETKNLFDKGFMSLFDDSKNNKWVMSYFLDVFQSQNKETILKYREKYIRWLTDELSYGLEEYDITDSYTTYENLVFFQSEMKIESERFQNKSLFIKNIKVLPNGYCVTVKGDSSYKKSFTEKRPTPFQTLPWPDPGMQEFFDLYLILDGDYLDIYLDSLENHFATFARVNQNFSEQLHSLLSNNTADISKITWPKRADGRMDYPLTNKKLLESYTPTHRTSTALRLRADASTKAGYFATLPEGGKVQVIEVGRTETIDTISAPWVHVLTGKGFYGWCFSGYLKKIPK